ncbi:MAG: hypothetical protein JWL65_1326 [Gammaproteobacteria bacterium]|jgi:hypothetical protein|nr:hypothetical protein [Gammaproteobacteria bacterium]
MKISSVLSITAVAAVVCAVTVPVSAAPMACSIHPPKGLSESQMAKLAKISLAEAEKTALASLHSSTNASISSAELEAEHGCLLWSFDLKIAGKTGVQEVQVDAGDGKVLSVTHETSQQEATER